VRTPWVHAGKLRSRLSFWLAAFALSLSLCNYCAWVHAGKLRSCLSFWLAAMYAVEVGAPLPLRNARRRGHCLHDNVWVCIPLSSVPLSGAGARASYTNTRPPRVAFGLIMVWSPSRSWEGSQKYSSAPLIGSASGYFRRPGRGTGSISSKRRKYHSMQADPRAWLRPGKPRAGTRPGRPGRRLVGCVHVANADRGHFWNDGRRARRAEGAPDLRWCAAGDPPLPLLT
jgi:hypothetical protein